MTILYILLAWAIFCTVVNVAVWLKAFTYSARIRANGWTYVNKFYLDEVWMAYVPLLNLAFWVMIDSSAKAKAAYERPENGILTVRTSTGAITINDNTDRSVYDSYM